MPFVDPNTVHDPTAGGVAPAAWGDIVRDDLLFLAGPARCRLRAVASQTVASGSPVAIAWDTEDYDTDTMHSTATNTSRITFNTAGTYDLKGGLFLGVNTGGDERTLNIFKNGTTDLATHIGTRTTGGAAALTIVTDSVFVVGDYVELRLYHDADVPLTVHDAQRSFFSARWASL